MDWWFDIWILFWKLTGLIREEVGIILSFTVWLLNGCSLSMVPSQLVLLGASSIQKLTKMLLWLSVILFSMANTVVIHFLWLCCSTVSYVLCFPELSLHRDDEVVPWPSTHPLHPVMWGENPNSQAVLHQIQEYVQMLFIQISVSPRSLKLLNERMSILVRTE